MLKSESFLMTVSSAFAEIGWHMSQRIVEQILTSLCCTFSSKAFKSFLVENHAFGLKFFDSKNFGWV